MVEVVFLCRGSQRILQSQPTGLFSIQKFQYVLIFLTHSDHFLCENSCWNKHVQISNLSPCYFLFLSWTKDATYEQHIIVLYWVVFMYCLKALLHQLIHEDKSSFLHEQWGVYIIFNPRQRICRENQHKIQSLLLDFPSVCHSQNQIRLVWVEFSRGKTQTLRDSLNKWIKLYTRIS